MRLVVITAIWKRPEATAIMLDSLNAQGKRLTDKIDLRVVVAGSEGLKSRDLACSHGAIYTEIENQPLGRKWTHALRTAKNLNPDAVLIEGSDNILNDAMLLKWVEVLADGVDYVALLDAYQFSTIAWTLIYWPGYVGQREGEPIGASRCYGRDFLDRAEWSLWDERLRSSLDYSVTQRLKDIPHKAHFLRQKGTNIRHLGVKLKDAMSAALHTRKDVDQLDPQELTSWFGAIGKRVLKLPRG